jgi:hypothetical protein
MIDYIKLLLLNIDITRLLLLPYLDFKTDVSKQTGELGTKQIAKYHHCKITIYDTGIVLFSGSIHKLYNSLNNIKAPNYNKEKLYKGYNGNQFKLVNILEVRTHLANLFDCQPHQMQFQNIEFGVNAEPVFNPDTFTKGLLYHNGEPFEYRFNNNYTQAIHQRFIFKIYNKGNQYGISTNTLRIELKFRKMKEVHVLGIKTFADINTCTLNKAKRELLKRFDEVVYYDYTINKKSLPSSLKKVLIKYSNPRYWLIKLKSNHRHREKKRLKKIIIDYSENLHSQIRKEIIKKCVIINQLSK